MLVTPQCSLQAGIASAYGLPGTRKAQPASLSIAAPAERLLLDKCLFSISQTTSLTTGGRFFATATRLRNPEALPAPEMTDRRRMQMGRRLADTHIPRSRSSRCSQSAAVALGRSPSP